MLLKIKTYLSLALGILAALLTAGLYREKYKSAKKDASIAKEAAETEKALKEELIKGEDEYNRKINRPIKRGHFTE